MKKRTGIYLLFAIVLIISAFIIVGCSEKNTTEPPENNAPTVAIVSPLDDANVAIQNITVSGTAEDEDGSVEMVMLKLNEGNWETTTGTTNWSIDVILEEGENNIIVKAMDNSDDWSDETNISVFYTVGAATPVVTITSPTEGETFTNAEITVFGTAEDIAAILYISDITMNSVNNKKSDYNKQNDDIDKHSVSISNQETKKSDLSVTKKTNNKIDNKIKQRDIIEVMVRVNNNSWETTIGNTNWNIDVTLEPGENIIYAIAKNENNIYSEEVSVNVILSDTDGPTNPSPVNGATNQPTALQLSWDFSSADSYDVYLSSSNPPTDLIADDITVSNFNVASLVYSTQYYWQVVANIGGSTAESDVWNFTIEEPPVDVGYKIIGHTVETELPCFVNIMYQVTDMDGIGVNYLQQSDFVVLEDGESLSPSETAMQIRKKDAFPYSIKTVLMLDNSSSIGNDDLEIIKQAAIEVVNNISEEQTIKVYKFSDEPIALTDFTNDDAELISAINSITLGFPSTNLYGSVIEGVNSWDDTFSLEGIEQGFMILLTDGSDTQGSSSFNEAMQAIENGQKRVYTVGLGDEIDEATLMSLGTAGYIPVLYIDDLVEQFGIIQAQIILYSDSFYVLNYMSPKRGNINHTLTLSIDGNINTEEYFEYTGSFNSDGFYSVYQGVFVNYSEADVDGIDELDIFVGQTIELEAVSFGGDTLAVFEWTSGDTDILNVDTDRLDTDIINVIGAGTGTTTLTVEDTANDFTKILDITATQAINAEISYPQDGDVLQIGQSFTIEVDASTILGYISEVIFYVNEELIGTDTSYPYSQEVDTFNLPTGNTSISVTVRTTSNIEISLNISILLSGCNILSPTEIQYGELFEYEENIQFIGSAYDLEDGELSGNSLVWSSDLDGQIGTGNNFTNNSLSEGTHQITLTATDTEGNPLTDQCFLRNFAWWIFVEGSTFEMGDHFNEGYHYELPVHSITLSDFYIGAFEVTQAEFETVMGYNDAVEEYGLGNTYPVYNVDWYDAVEYCNTLSIQEGLTPCYIIDGDDTTCNFEASGYRLPTEAEWEYAARGGINHTDDFRYSGCHNESELQLYAWYNSPNTISHEVGTKLPNQLGLYDMSGNVNEWCWDWFDQDYYDSSPSNNPHGPNTGPLPYPRRVFRSGASSSSSGYCRVAKRQLEFPHNQFTHLGFRIVRNAE